MENIIYFSFVKMHSANCLLFCSQLSHHPPFSFRTVCFFPAFRHLPNSEEWYKDAFIKFVTHGNCINKKKNGKVKKRILLTQIFCFFNFYPLLEKKNFAIFVNLGSQTLLRRDLRILCSEFPLLF